MSALGIRLKGASDSKSENKGPPRNVLVVEDEVLIATLLAEMLKDLNFCPIGPIHEFEQAIQAANEKDIDLALLDLKLDERESYAIAEILRARNIPFIFVTGHERESIVSTYQDCTVLMKPFDDDDLKIAISNVMDD